MSNDNIEKNDCTCKVIQCLLKEIKDNKNCCWIQASSKKTQVINKSNIGQVVIIDTVDGSKKVRLNSQTGQIKVLCEGDYFIMAAPQVGRCKDRCYNDCGHNDISDFRCWIRVNGTNVSNSNVLLSLAPQTKDVIVSQGIVHLNEGDIVEVVMATNDGQSGVEIQAIQPTPNEPLVPSIIFSLFKIC